jgi:hypothetical protein
MACGFASRTAGAVLACHRFRDGFSLQELQHDRTSYFGSRSLSCRRIRVGIGFGTNTRNAPRLSHDSSDTAEHDPNDQPNGDGAVPQRSFYQYCGPSELHRTDDDYTSHPNGSLDYDCRDTNTNPDDAVAHDDGPNHDPIADANANAKYHDGTNNANRDIDADGHDEHTHHDDSRYGTSYDGNAYDADGNAANGNFDRHDGTHNHDDHCAIHDGQQRFEPRSYYANWLNRSIVLAPIIGSIHSNCPTPTDGSVGV